MLKVITLAVFIVVTVQRSIAGPEEMAKIILDCRATVNVTDADITNLKNKVKVVTKEAKCFQTCLAEKIGLISHQVTTINKDGCMKFRNYKRLRRNQGRRKM